MIVYSNNYTILNMLTIQELVLPSLAQLGKIQNLAYIQGRNVYGVLSHGQTGIYPELRYRLRLIDSQREKYAMYIIL